MNIIFETFKTFKSGITRHAETNEIWKRAHIHVDIKP